MTLAHLRPTYDARLTGDAVADLEVRLDHVGFRTAVGATARRLGALGVGRVMWLRWCCRTGWNSSSRCMPRGCWARRSRR
jgi:hypothetical protein